MSDLEPADGPTPDQPACPACGRPIDPAAWFCEACGSPLVPTAPPPPPPAPAADAPSTQTRRLGVRASQVASCASCGGTIGADGYCSGCRRTLAEVAGWARMSADEQWVVIRALPAREESNERR